MKSLGSLKFSEQIIEQTDFTAGMLPASPRMRICRTISPGLALTNTFQRINFNGTSTYNTNTFPQVAGQNYRLVDWDATNKLINFHADVDRNYIVSLDYSFTAGLRPATILMRFVVPAPTPIYFPLPDQTKYTTLITLETIAEAQGTFLYSLSAGTNIRQYGLGIEMRLSQNIVVGSAMLQETNALIYAQY